MGYYTTYYTFGLPSFLVITIALYLLFTGALLTRISVSNYWAQEVTTQARERRSMLASFWRNQARSYGRQLVLAYASG